MKMYLIGLEQSGKCMYRTYGKEDGTTVKMVGFESELPNLKPGKCYEVKFSESDTWRNIIKVGPEAEIEDDPELVKAFGPKPVPTLKDIVEVIVDYVNKTPDRDNNLEPRQISVKQVMDAVKCLFEDDMENARKFTRIPASLSYHDAQIGGLLIHIYNMVKMASECMVADGVFRQYNLRPLVLMIGILVHDIGKVEQYNDNNGIWEQSDEARYIGGHITTGSIRWGRKGQKACEILGYPKMYIDIMHIILSHHGNKELGYGSVISPQSPEAWAIHALDLMDSRQEKFFIPKLSEEEWKAKTEEG